MVKMLDDDVGRISTRLEDMGILENTVLIFTSDNGHEIYYPVKGRTSKNAAHAKSLTSQNNLIMYI